MSNHSENFVVAMAEMLVVIIIKLADRLHNVQTLKHLSPEKAKRIALETIEIHAPMANRLGMWRLKGELEDLSFPYAYPKEFQDVEKLIAGRTGADENIWIRFTNLSRKELAGHNKSFRYKLSHKGTYSLYKN